MKHCSISTHSDGQPVSKHNLWHAHTATAVGWNQDMQCWLAQQTISQYWHEQRQQRSRSNNSVGSCGGSSAAADLKPVRPISNSRQAKPPNSMIHTQQTRRIIAGRIRGRHTHTRQHRHHPHPFVEDWTTKDDLNKNKFQMPQLWAVQQMHLRYQI